MNILDRFPVFRNKAAKSKRITEGSNVTRPGATDTATTFRNRSGGLYAGYPQC